MSRPRPSVSQRHRLGENAAWRSGIRGTLVGGRIAIFSGFRSCSRAVCLRHAAADFTALLSGPVSGEIDLTCCEPFVWLGLFIYSVWLLFGWVLLLFMVDNCCCFFVVQRARAVRAGWVFFVPRRVFFGCCRKALFAPGVPVASRDRHQGSSVLAPMCTGPKKSPFPCSGGFFYPSARHGGPNESLSSRTGL